MTSYYRYRVLTSFWCVIVLSLSMLSVVQPKSNRRLRQPSKVDGRALERTIDDISNALREMTTDCGEVNRQASEWISDVDYRLGLLDHELTVATWNYLTNLTDENADEMSRVQAIVDDWSADLLPTVRQYLEKADQICNSTTLRLLHRFLNSSTMPIANDPETRKRVNRLVASLEEIYSTVTVKDSTGKEYRLDPELTELMTNSRDYDQLKWAWEAWHNATGPRMKSKYAQLVDGMNEGARDNGFADVGIVWQVSDFEIANVEKMMDKLYIALKPFYQQLHAYVRRRLIVAYPNRGIDPKGPIPAHLLGDMWAQVWGNIIDLLLPYPNTSRVDITAALLKAKYTPVDLFRMSEEFFTSLGLEPMTHDFWTKSVFVRPSDNTPMACHASADDFYQESDFRIKMCAEVNQNDFETIHHEMGHIEYFMQYRHQPTLFRAGANAAFHEAIGDTISLSVMTTKHLKTVKLIPSQPAGTNSARDIYEADINFLMTMALNKIAFVPFAYVMDKWRYRVFRGDVGPLQYNIDWWKLRKRYQGLVPPSPRPIDEFDPGSKYHIPANVPYSRYFFSFIGQFQFHATLCELAGHQGPLYQCDIYRSTAAGDRLKSVLRLGASHPWPEAMELFTGQREFRVDAMLNYFQPLIKWLERENAGHPIGW